MFLKILHKIYVNATPATEIQYNLSLIFIIWNFVYLEKRFPRFREHDRVLSENVN